MLILTFLFYKQSPELVLGHLEVSGEKVFETLMFLTFSADHVFDVLNFFLRQYPWCALLENSLRRFLVILNSSVNFIIYCLVKRQNICFTKINPLVQFVVDISATLAIINQSQVGSEFQSKLKETFHIYGSFKNSFR